jgi:hypothetical protein
MLWTFFWPGWALQCRLKHTFHWHSLMPCSPICNYNDNDRTANVSLLYVRMIYQNLKTSLQFWGRENFTVPVNIITVFVNYSDFPELEATQATSPLKVICASGELDYKRWVNYKVFWQWCITLGITEFLDFGCCLVFRKNTMFQKLDLHLRSSDRD